MSAFLRPLMCLVITCAVLNNTALAGDTVSLSVTGNVLAAPCDIRSDSVTKTVDLGDGAPVQAGLLQTPGSATKWIPFTLGLVNCPGGTTKATIEFSGKPDAVNPEDLYENTGTAGNIAIQLQGAGESRSETVNVSPGTLRPEAIRIISGPGFILKPAK